MKKADPIPCKRCSCNKPEPRQADDKTMDCAKCSGWFAVSISTPKELDAFFTRFAP